VKYFVKDSLPFKDSSLDTVSMIAVLEHLEFKKKVLQEILRVLKKGGKLVMTIPSPKAEYIIRLFAFFKLISKELADEHKDMMDKKQIKELLNEIGFHNMEVSTFEFGMNYLISAEK
jgi:ubiquinone/menaquinone biosynthesis C-methylase UbiE